MKDVIAALFKRVQKYFRNWHVTTIEVVVVIIIIFLVVAAISGSSRVEEERQRLIQQCMDDGKKEYECEAILKRPATPTTIVIPTS